MKKTTKQKPRHRVNVYLRPEELARIDKKAKALRWTRSSLIRKAVDDFETAVEKADHDKGNR